MLLNQIKRINITFYQKGHSCPSQQKKDLQNLMWLPCNLNYEVIKKSSFINFSHCSCSPHVLQCFMKIILFFLGLLWSFSYSQKELLVLGKFSVLSSDLFFPLVIMKVLIEDINMAVVCEMAGMEHCQCLCAKKFIIADYYLY